MNIKQPYHGGESPPTPMNKPNTTPDARPVMDETDYHRGKLEAMRNVSKNDAHIKARLVEFVSRFAESFGQVESQLDSPELEMLQDARTLLNDLLGDNDDAKRAYMQRSMRETRKK